MLSFILPFSTFAILVQSQECNIQIAEYGQVCVCNATYCDTVPNIDVPPGNYQFYSTSKSKLGFYSTTGSFLTESREAIYTITVDQLNTYQTIIGFGGTFTDATGINIASLPEAAQQKLVESYFSETGIEYNLCRVPLGGTDSSIRAYSYDDNFDPLLINFALQPEDINYKIPYIQQATRLRNNRLRLFGSVWSSPPWMKTNNAFPPGFLLREFYQVWANYFIKFLDEYQANNITFWAVTTQNEPSTGFIPNVTLNSIAWSPEQLNFWVGHNLGPTLKNSVHKDVKIILHDDQRLIIPFLLLLLNDELTMKYADGVGVHWYWDTVVLPGVLQLVASPYKDVFIIGTEACNGYLASTGEEVAVAKGSWDRGAQYAVDILGNLQYGAAGWVDWNMVLSEAGGPNYINNFVDSPVLVNSALQEFYKQPMFYVLGHFSKFVVPGSVRVDTTLSESLISTNGKVQALAFLRPDNLTALLIYNNGTFNITIQVQDSKNQIVNLDIEAFSINTLLFE